MSNKPEPGEPLFTIPPLPTDEEWQAILSRRKAAFPEEENQPPETAGGYNRKTEERSAKKGPPILGAIVESSAHPHKQGKPPNIKLLLKIARGVGPKYIAGEVRDQMQELIDAGFVAMVVSDPATGAVEYSVTDQGRKLVGKVNGLG
jgi:hypothetical protein